VLAVQPEPNNNEEAITETVIRYMSTFCISKDAYERGNLAIKNKRMKIEKFKVLLYLKKSGLDKFGRAPIMGRITVNNTMAQFSCKLSCTPELWNPRES